MSTTATALAYLGLMFAILFVGLRLEWTGDTLLMKLRGPVWFRIPVTRLTFHKRGLLITALFFVAGWVAADHQLVPFAMGAAVLAGLSFFFLALGSDDFSHKRRADEAMSEEDEERLAVIAAAGKTA
jgi:hypothetical protein